MGRKILIVLLALGALGGFAAGVHHWRHGRCYAGYGAHAGYGAYEGYGPRGRHGGWGPHAWGGHGRQAMFEEHVADVCVQAALRARPAGADTPATVTPPAGIPAPSAPAPR